MYSYAYISWSDTCHSTRCQLYRAEWCALVFYFLVPLHQLEQLKKLGHLCSTTMKEYTARRGFRRRWITMTLTDITHNPR